MKARRVLLVEDDLRMRELLKMYLENEPFEVDEAGDGEEALQKIESMNYELVILDIMIPKIDGWMVCKEINKNHNIPVIIVTARGEEGERILGLELGADDYLVKPFSPKELIARIHALFRRMGRIDNGKNDVIKFANLKINRNSRKVTVGDLPVTLTPREYDLLEFFALNSGIVFKRELLLDRVWGDQFCDIRTVDTHVKQLREKICRRLNGPDLIKTVWGVGYKFEVAE